MMKRTRQHCLFVAIMVTCLLAEPNQAWDGPADNSFASVRPIPPAGIEIPAVDREQLQAGLRSLQEAIEPLKIAKSKSVTTYLPDVLIFEKAVRIALTEDGFFAAHEVDSAKSLLAEGLNRAKELGNLASLTNELVRPTWAGPLQSTARGHTVRGFVSRLDGSVQPYGIAWNAPRGRSDVWCRGRSEKGLELQFLAAHSKGSVDPLPVAGVVMIYPLGRYCNANKLAGEVDTLEALEHAIQQYSLDPNQVAIRGFSMGGAAAWHLAVHYPDKWFAATPGAGFSETPQFLKVFQSESLSPSPSEQSLWQLYDCDKWALNLKNLPIIAYSGALDKQKQAADVMAQACWNLPDGDSFELTHIVAADTAHVITPTARREIERRLSKIHSISQQNPLRDRVWFTTYTLKYNRCHWLTIEALDQHWQPATVKAHIKIDEPGIANLDVETSGVREFTVELDADVLPIEVQKMRIRIANMDHAELANQVYGTQIARRSDLSWCSRWRYDASKQTWKSVSSNEPAEGLSKRHNLQGPIDDAFMDSFVFVRPSGSGLHAAVDAWVESEFNHAITAWHRQMRGDVRVVTADELKEVDIKNNHLILWGDPSSNAKLAEILDKLPIKWNSQQLTIASKEFAADTHVPILVYPNPLAPGRYVVLNSGFTFREYDYLNNARQIPKLPDWAIIDIRTPADARWPGKVVLADFFDETWQVKQ
jgi:pimeloyl-ACP methyl ester carboxylesterase